MDGAFGQDTFRLLGKHAVRTLLYDALVCRTYTVDRGKS